MKKEWVNRIVNPKKIVSSYYLDWLRERPDVATFIKVKIPIIIEKIAYQGNKIHINVKEFAKELAISSGLEERLTNSFGIPFKHIYKEKREPINRVELAKTYLKLLEDGKFETQAELSRHLGVSRAWVTIIMNTIKNKNPN